MQNQESLVTQIIQSMQDIVVKHGLDLMQRYPNDLLVHDKAHLMGMATPGAQFAWVVGDAHTHIVSLGLSKEENENVGYLTKLANKDKFYTIKINTGNRVVFTELDRKAFEALASTPVRYSMSCGDFSNFWLMSGKNAIGHILVESVGTIQERKMLGHVRPVEGISLLDTVALKHWVGHAIIKTAGTLFIRSDTVWDEAIPQQQAA